MAETDFIPSTPTSPLAVQYMVDDPISVLPESAQPRAQAMAQLLASIDVSSITVEQRGELLALFQSGQYQEMLSRINMPGLHTIRGFMDSVDSGAQALVSASGVEAQWNDAVRSTVAGSTLHVLGEGADFVGNLTSLPGDAATLAAAGIAELLSSGETRLSQQQAERIAAMTEGAYIMHTSEEPGWLTKISAGVTFLMENYLPTWLGGSENPRSWDVILNAAAREAASPLVRQSLIETGLVSEALAGLVTQGGQADVDGVQQDITLSPEGVGQEEAQAPIIPTSADEARESLTELADSAKGLATATGGLLYNIYSWATADDRGENQRIYDGLPSSLPEGASPIVQEAMALRDAIEDGTDYFNRGTMMRTIPLPGMTILGGVVEQSIADASRPQDLIVQFGALIDRARNQGGYYDLLVASREIHPESDRVNRAVIAGLPVEATENMPESVAGLIASRRLLAEAVGIDPQAPDLIEQLRAHGKSKDADQLLLAVEGLRHSDPTADVFLTRLVQTEPAWSMFDGERGAANYAMAQSEEYTFGEVRALLADPQSALHAQLAEQFGAEFDTARQRVVDQYVADYGVEPEEWELRMLMEQSPDFSSRGDYYSVSLLEREQFIATRISELTNEGRTELGTYHNDAEPSGIRRTETAVQPATPAADALISSVPSIDGGLYAAAVEAEARRAAAVLSAAETTGGETVEGGERRPETTAMLAGVQPGQQTTVRQ